MVDQTKLNRFFGDVLADFSGARGLPLPTSGDNRRQPKWLWREAAEAPARPMARVRKERCREEVFRTALDHYIARYQMQHAATTDDVRRGEGHSGFAHFWMFVRWFRS